jgi:glutathione S-transferase
MLMPTLKDGDYVLWESNAILQYLAALRPESGLLPAEERARLEVTRWQFWDLAHWDPCCAVFIFERVVKRFVRANSEAPDPAAIEAAEERMRRWGPVLNAQLEGRRFVTGDTLTVADFSLGAALNFGPLAAIPIEPYPEICRWHAALGALPAWSKTLSATAMPAAAA